MGCLSGNVGECCPSLCACVSCRRCFWISLTSSRIDFSAGFCSTTTLYATKEAITRKASCAMFRMYDGAVSVEKGNSINENVISVSIATIKTPIKSAAR